MSVRPRGIKGFTLIELMVVVCILGLLASVAASSLTKYVKMAKTVEAFEALYKIRLGAREYFIIDHWLDNGKLLPHQFPSETKPTPASGPCCERCITPNNVWAERGWSGLMFMLAGPHYFQYIFNTSGVSYKSTYTAYAVGDLDCDTTTSSFELRGSIDTDGVPTAIGPLITRGLE